MKSIQEIVKERDSEAERAIWEQVNGIPAAREYRAIIERGDTALYGLLRAVYFAGRDAGIKAATLLVSKEGE